MTRIGDNIYHYDASDDVTYIDLVLQNGKYLTKYLFNGKELDTETGLAYYGARYYSPELGVWYGVDPLMEKYPTFSPYVFCAGNPVKYIDPDGMELVSGEPSKENENGTSSSARSSVRDYNRDIQKKVELDGGTTNDFDQKYGQPVIGGMGEDSKTTSEFTGPSIDGGPKYIDQYKTIKGWIDKLFGKKYEFQEHRIKEKDSKIYHNARPEIKMIPTGEKDGVFRNYRKDTIFIIDEEICDGKIISTDTIWRKDQK